MPESVGRGVGEGALKERQTPQADASSGSGTPGTREAGSSATPGWLPHQRRGTSPQMRGRYPDYDVLAEAQHWDEPTRAVVLARVASPTSSKGEIGREQLRRIAEGFEGRARTCASSSATTS